MMIVMGLPVSSDTVYRTVPKPCIWTGRMVVTKSAEQLLTLMLAPVSNIKLMTFVKACRRSTLH